MGTVSNSLDGRVVAITGAARGIGLATAKQLVAAGALVAIGDIDGDEAARQAALIPGVVASTLDVTDHASFRAFIEVAESSFGPLDVLINNAGIMPIGPFLEESDATAQRVLEIDVAGVLVGMKLALPGMLARGRGQIVNVASIAGKSPVPGGLTYAAAKAAVISATETARVEFVGRGVDFTCVMPSFTATDLIAGTKGVRFIKNVTPEAVATAITAAVAEPVCDVFVPKSVGTIARTQPLIGRRLRDWINHVIRADRTFLDVDRGARSYYEDRISKAGSPSPESSELIEPELR